MLNAAFINFPRWNLKNLAGGGKINVVFILWIRQIGFSSLDAEGKASFSQLNQYFQGNFGACFPPELQALSTFDGLLSQT